nr:hypothetical protein [Tanacetum cinerariifolium]
DGEEGNGDDDDDDEDDDGEEGDDDDANQEVGRDDDKDDDEEGGDDKHESDEETKEEESFDPISQTPKDSEDEGNGEEDLSLNIGDEERHDEEEEEEEDELYRHFAGAVSSIPGIVNHYIDQRMNEAVRVVVQIQSDRLRDKTQRENDEFLRTVNENIKKIIKERVKEQVKAQVSKIFPRIKQIIIEKIEGNKSIQRSDEQRNLYKALVDAYEFDKIILDTYGETVTLKRRRDDDADKDEEPSTGPDRGSKRRKEGKEPESASAPMETVTRSAGSSNITWKKSTKPQQIKWTGSIPKVNSIHNLLQPLPVIPNNRGRHVIPFEHFIKNDLEYLWGGASSRYDKHALWGVSHWGNKRQQFYSFAVNRESARDVYSKRRIIAVTQLKIVEWHSNKHFGLDYGAKRR